MNSDKNIVDYNLPDYFTIFIDPDASRPNNCLLFGCREFTLSQLIEFYLSIHRDFIIVHITWEEADPWFERNDCLIFSNEVLL